MHQIELIHGLRSLRPRHRECVATIGAFDGVHRGHQALLKQTRAQSKQRGVPSVVIVFEPQPNEVFGANEMFPARLMRLREKFLAFQDHGIDRLLCLRFNYTMRHLSAEDFVQRVLFEGLGVQHLTVGDDFRFGSDREGSYRLLKEMGARLGFDVNDTHTCTSEEQRISSTRIRDLLADDDLDGACQLLGSPYSNVARVIYGKQLGRELGFPTLNFNLGRKRVPLQGVFVVTLIHAGQSYRGVANVGLRPTVDAAHPGILKPILEVHLLDVNVNLYGQFLSVTYIKKLRDEKKFASISELKKQISIDVECARDYFASEQ